MSVNSETVEEAYPPDHPLALAIDLRDRAENLRVTADKFRGWLIAVVIIGIFTIIAMPVFIGAGDATAKWMFGLPDLAARLRAKQDELDTTNTGISDTAYQRDNTIQSIRDGLQLPGSVWRIESLVEGPKTKSGTISDVLSLKNQNLIAVGHQGSGQDMRPFILERPAVASKLWAMVELPDDLTGKRGWISFVLDLNEHGLIATGFLGSLPNPRLLILEKPADAAKPWTMAKLPDELTGKQGWISFVLDLNEHGLIATGFLGSLQNQRLLILEKPVDAAKAWMMADLPDELTGKQGWITNILDLDEHGLIATGYLSSDEDRRPFILERPAGASKPWAMVELPDDLTGEQGGITSILDLNDSGLIAGGYLLSDGDRRPLILQRPADAEKPWTMSELPDDFTGKQGGITSIFDLDDHGLIAMGYLGSAEYRRPFTIERPAGAAKPWALVALPDNFAGKQGAITSILDLKDRGQIGLGYLGPISNPRLFLLERPTGAAAPWAMVELPDKLTGKEGEITSVFDMKERGLMAFGYLGPRGDRKRFILHRPATAAKPWQVVKNFESDWDLIDLTDLGTQGILSFGKRGTTALIISSSKKLVADTLTKLEPKTTFQAIRDLEARPDIVVGRRVLDLNENLNPKPGADKNSLASKLANYLRDQKSLSQDIDSLQELAKDQTDKILNGLARLTVLALLIYLVQILINLHRYNTRLAGFYDARADALFLIATSDAIADDVIDLPFDQLSAVLAPDGLDFTKAPQTPVQSAVELAKEILRVAKPGK